MSEHEIGAYRGYANGRRVLVLGRVQGAKHIPPATATDSMWRDLINTFKRVDADPLPHARVRVAIGGTGEGGAGGRLDARAG